MIITTTPFTFSYIVVDQRLNDKDGKPVLGVYSFATKDERDLPIRVLQSSTPAITANIYAGNPYPGFDITDAIEQRVKLDIQSDSNFGALDNTRINDSQWHLTPIAHHSDVEIY
jgi:hypothetical protein